MPINICRASWASMRTGKFIRAVCYHVINIQRIFLTFYDIIGGNLIITIFPLRKILQAKKFSFPKSTHT